MSGPATDILKCAIPPTKIKEGANALLHTQHLDEDIAKEEDSRLHTVFITKIRIMARRLRVSTACERIKERTINIIDRLESNWKHNGAKAFARFLRNASKIPRTTFADPDNDGKLTSDPVRIAEIFTKAWQPIFNWQDGETKPS